MTINSQRIYLKISKFAQSAFPTVQEVWKRPTQTPSRANSTMCAGADKWISRRLQVDGTSCEPKHPYAATAATATAAVLRPAPAPKIKTYCYCFFFFPSLPIQHSIKRFLVTPVWGMTVPILEKERNDTWVGNIFAEGISNHWIVSEWL